MEIVLHRINTVAALANIPSKYGCEIDIRTKGSELILHHEPYQNGDLLSDYLDNYQHGLLILNTKEAGIENDILTAVRKRGNINHFLLDVEFPYLYKAARLGEKSIAIRYSEDEPIELVKKYTDKVNWVWIDTISQLPLNDAIVNELNGFNTCLVCPERWGRPQDILSYRSLMKALDFCPTAVMTNIKYVPLWEKEI